MSLALAVLLASLLGSVHCAAMCGGFVGFYSVDGPAGAVRRWSSHAAYNVGRLVAYVLLGAIAGALGGGIDRVASRAGVDRAAALLAGSLMVAWGASRLAAIYGVRMPGFSVSPAMQRRLGSLMGAAGRWSPRRRAAALGLLSALLPCGWLYAFVATASGTGSAVHGALVMLFFWAGTLPVLLALGAGIQRAAGPLQRRLPAFSATLVVIIGLLAIGGRLRAWHGAAMRHDVYATGLVPHGGH